MFLNRGRQFGDRTGRRITRQNQVQNRHEMAFTAAEAAMQIGGFAGGTLQRTSHEAQRVIERSDQLRGRNIGGNGRFGIGDTLGQAQYERPLIDVFGDVDEFFKECHE